MRKCVKRCKASAWASRTVSSVRAAVDTVHKRVRDVRLSKQTIGDITGGMAACLPHAMPCHAIKSSTLTCSMAVCCLQYSNSRHLASLKIVPLALRTTLRRAYASFGLHRRNPGSRPRQRHDSTEHSMSNHDSGPCTVTLDILSCAMRDRMVTGTSMTNIVNINR
jgi:hypothetical protein